LGEQSSTVEQSLEIHIGGPHSANLANCSAPCGRHRKNRSLWMLLAGNALLDPSLRSG
jgi:hypothetical protein